MKNVGKKFEEAWKKSCPSDVMIYRPPDSAQGFDVGASSKLRFSQHSPCDFFMFNGKKLYTIECKTFEGACSFERSKEDKGIIHYYQIKSLHDFAQYQNVVSGLILDFRKTDNTYFLSIENLEILIASVNKKSFNEDDMLLYCSPYKISKKKLKVNYKYNIGEFLENYEL